MRVLARLAGNDRHAVIGLLTGPDSVVPDFGESFQRKMLVGQFQFLQTQHINRVVMQPGQHLLQTHPEGVHIPSSQFHDESEDPLRKCHYLISVGCCHAVKSRN